MSDTIFVCLALLSMLILRETIEDMVLEDRIWVFLGTNTIIKEVQIHQITLKPNIQITQ